MRFWLLALGSALLAACGPSATPPRDAKCGPCASGAAEGPSLPPPRSSKLEGLAQQRVDLAKKRLLQLRQGFAKGAVTFDTLFTACRDVAYAARDSGMHGEALRDVLTEYRGAVVALKELTKERYAKGAVDDDAVAKVDALEAEANFWLEEANANP